MPGQVGAPCPVEGAGEAETASHLIGCDGLGSYAKRDSEVQLVEY